MRRRNTCYFVRQQDIKDHIEVEPFEKELSIKELRLLGRKNPLFDNLVLFLSCIRKHSLWKQAMP